MDLNTRRTYFLVVDVPKTIFFCNVVLILEMCDMLTMSAVVKKSKQDKTKQKKTPKVVSTVNAVFYRTPCGSLQIRHLQSHDLYATHTEDHVGEKKPIGESLCTETYNKLPLTQLLLSDLMVIIMRLQCSGAS